MILFITCIHLFVFPYYARCMTAALPANIARTIPSSSMTGAHYTTLLSLLSTAALLVSQTVGGLQESDFIFQPAPTVRHRVEECAPLVSPPRGQLMDRHGEAVSFPVHISQLSSVLYSKTPKTGSTTITGVLQRLSLLYPDVALHVIQSFIKQAVLGVEEVQPWCEHYAAMLAGKSLPSREPYGESLAFFLGRKQTIMDVSEAGLAHGDIVGASLRRTFGPNNSSECECGDNLNVPLTFVSPLSFPARPSTSDGICLPWPYGPYPAGCAAPGVLKHAFSNIFHARPCCEGDIWLPVP